MKPQRHVLSPFYGGAYQRENCFFAVIKRSDILNISFQQNIQKMSITNSTLKHISFGESINWNLLNQQKRRNSQNRKKIIRLFSNQEEDCSNTLMEDEPGKKIKIKTAATFSSEDNNFEQSTDLKIRQRPATDRVGVSENPFLRAKASYIQKTRSRIMKKNNPFDQLSYGVPQTDSEIITFRQLKIERELKSQSTILGNCNCH